jgi:hypothetical protein
MQSTGNGFTPNSYVGSVTAGWTLADAATSPGTPTPGRPSLAQHQLRYVLDLAVDWDRIYPECRGRHVGTDWTLTEQTLRELLRRVDMMVILENHLDALVRLHTPWPPALIGGAYQYDHREQSEPGVAERAECRPNRNLDPGGLCHDGV